MNRPEQQSGGQVKFPHAPSTPEWQRAADREARDYAPTIKACRDCGAPVVSGFCCNYCGSVEP